LSEQVHSEPRADAVRSGVGVCRLGERGLIEVSGGDRVRWLDGMLSNDVTSLEMGGENSGCYATTLTAKGRIVADLHVLLCDDAFWLETAASAVQPLIDHFERHLIADDVVLRDISSSVERFSVEGPQSHALLVRASETPLALSLDSCAVVRIAKTDVVTARYGWSGELAFQLLVPTGAGEAVVGAIENAADVRDSIMMGEKTLTVLRIEAGIPLFGAEIDETVLPAEARLGRAVAKSKGCYVGQEVVARMEAAGRVSHLLVGLSLEDGPLPESGCEIWADAKRVGEVTSRCVSERAGAIALAFVRAAHAAPGTRLRVGDRVAEVAELPFVTPQEVML
jgi:folate-binding protein YgfZ